MRRIFVLALLTLGVWFGLPLGAPAYAADACDTIVIDRTSDKVLGDPLEIESAALRLENLGIDVRVRAFETEPSGSFNAYQKQQVQSCSSWQGPSEVTKGNLVTLLFSMDRQSYIFYGSNLEAELNDEVDRIRADYMNAEFKNGDFPGAITGTMAEIARVIDAHNNPEPSGPTTVNNEASSGGNALGWVLAVLAALAAAVALVFGGIWLLKGYRRRQEELAEAKLAAEAAEQNASEAMTALNGFPDSKRGADIIMPALNEEDQDLLFGLMNEFEGQNGRAVTAASNIVDNPSVFSLSEARKLAEYNRIAEAHTEVAQLANDAKATMRRLDDEVQNKDREIKEAPKAHDAATTMLADLKVKREGLVAEGYRFNGLDDHFASIEDLLVRAETELVAKRNGHALDELRSCDELLQSIQATLAKVPRWHKELQEECRVDAELLVETEAILDTAIGVRREIAEQYTNCDSDLATEGEMQILLTRALASLDLAKVASGMDRQQWNVADQHLADCANNLRSIKSDSESIADRFTKLASLRETLPTRFDTLETEIIETSEAIDDRKGEQKKFERKLATCSESLAQLRRDFEVSKPNLFSINTELTSLEAQLKKIEGDSEDVHKKEVRRRSAQSSSSSNGFGTGLGTGYVAGSVFGSNDYGGSSTPSYDSGGSSGGSWGGGDGGSSGGSW